MRSALVELDPDEVLKLKARKSFTPNPYGVPVNQVLSYLHDEAHPQAPQQAMALLQLNGRRQGTGSSDTRGLSLKVQVIVPMKIALASGLVTQSEVSTAAEAQTAPSELERLLVSAHLHHTGHTPKDPADLMNLPVDPRYIIKGYTQLTFSDILT